MKTAIISGCQRKLTSNGLSFLTISHDMMLPVLFLFSKNSESQALALSLIQSLKANNGNIYSQSRGTSETEASRCSNFLRPHKLIPTVPEWTLVETLTLSGESSTLYNHCKNLLQKLLRGVYFLETLY